GERRAGAYAHQQPFLAGAAAGHFLRGFGLDLNRAIDRLGVQVSGHETRADALNRVRAGLTAADYRAECRLDRVGLEAGPGLLEFLGAGRQVPAGADSGDDRVERCVGEVVEDLARGGLGMDLDVGRV